MANPMYGSNKFDNDVDSHDEYLDFCSGYVGNLTTAGIEVTQAEGVAGVKGGDETLAEVDAATFIANAVNTFAGTGAAAASSYLPPATKGTYLAVEVTGDIDQTGAWTIHANNSVGTVKPVGNVLAKQLIGVHIGDTVTPVETAGTYAAPTSENLIYTAAAADTNILGIGSMVFFYCPKDGEWLARVYPLGEGTGATGVFSVS
jgi:hypothetical protein|tara:strand:+ start:9284 stop:9892 length:609 start_codon:yes stop_codon:yes gene_type:complete